MTETDDDGTMRTTRSSDDHHERLRSELHERIDAVAHTVSSGHPHEPALARLMYFVRDDVLPHLEAEQEVLYPAARAAGNHDLVEALECDHRAVLTVIGEIDRSSTATQAALRAHTLGRLFSLRAEKEENILIPSLERAGVDVSELLDRVVVQMATEHDSRFTYF